MSAKLFKKGDRVRVRNNLVVDDAYGGYSFSGGMKRSKGKIIIIYEPLKECYQIQESIYYYTDEMLEPVKKARPMKFEIAYNYRLYSVQCDDRGFVVGYYSTSSNAKRGLNRFIKKIQNGDFEIEVKK